LSHWSGMTGRAAPRAFDSGHVLSFNSRRDTRRRNLLYAVLVAALPSAACAAASRAMGTRNGEHET
jgi:hypothetical protein